MHVLVKEATASGPYILSDFFFFFQVCIAVDLPPVGKRFEEWIDGCLSYILA